MGSNFPNCPMRVFNLAEAALNGSAAKDAREAMLDLRSLAVSAVLQLEALKEEVHRLAGPSTHDPRTLVLLRDTARLIGEMRDG